MRAVLPSIVLLGALPTLCWASPDAFDCKVLSLNELSPGGLFVSDTKDQKEQIGSTFSVDRKSGEIRGGYFLNNRTSKSIRVINEPQTDAFYVISESHGPFKMISYLYIANQANDLLKPFTYTSSGQYIYTGICQ